MERMRKGIANMKVTIIYDNEVTEAGKVIDLKALINY